MNALELDKLNKLKKMKTIATGLLIFMAVTYIVLKKFGGDSFLVSCIIAIAEASMIGALADWFAVVALFKHPMGMKWIPHTAIIQQNKDRIGDSLASFVVENFFTPDVLRNKLCKIHITENILKYVIQNKKIISEGLLKYTPEFVELLFKNEKLTDSIEEGIRSMMNQSEVSPYVSNLLSSAISSKLHVPLLKQVVKAAYHFVNENKEDTMKLLEGINKTFALPIVGDLTYRSIVKALNNLQIEIENEIQTPLVNEILHHLPAKIVERFQNSEDLHQKMESKKNEFIMSSTFSTFIQERLHAIKDTVITHSIDSREELTIKVEAFVEVIADNLQSRPEFSKIEIWVQDTLINIIGEYKEGIGKLISDTVKDWPMENMVEKLEIQVGGDLQYIRINGTVIGGLAGLLIHLISYYL